MKRIKSVTIGGKRWRVAWLELRHDWGLCSKHEGLIEMDKGIKDNLTYATILMHEMCHAMLPNVEEDFITQMADDLAVALQRAGLIAEDEDDAKA